MKKVRIAGVPEHFNFPWQLCIDNGEFEEVDLDLEWSDIPEGTGRMCKLLRENETDLAVILTEGIIKDIADGNPSIIVQEYVASPLLWGIHVAHNASFQNISELEHKRIAISRLGSGSHLMAIVHAKQQNWDTDKLEFVIVNTLDGAVESLKNGTADYFMWERFMTQPLVDQSIFRRLGVCPTPWPSFVIAGRKDFVESNTHIIDQVLEIINTTTSEFKYIPSIDRNLASKYDQKLDDIQQWLQLTTWSQKQIKKDTLTKVQNQLLELNLITEIQKHETITKL